MTIYPSITSISKNGALKKLKEANDLGLKEAAFFPTALTPKQRSDFYKKLKKSSIKKIPCLHLRNDMGKNEISWLIKTYKVEFLNIHSRRSTYPFTLDFSFCKDKVYLENSFATLELDEVQNFAGVCLDFAHLENSRRLQPNIYKKTISVAKKNKIGWAHISAIAKKNYISTFSGKPIYDCHFFSTLNEFDYLKRYRPIFPNVLALELENSLREQLEAKAYIEKLFKNL